MHLASTFNPIGYRLDFTSTKPLENAPNTFCWHDLVFPLIPTQYLILLTPYFLNTFLSSFHYLTNP